MMQGMVIDMNDEQLRTLAQLQAFLDGTVTVEFSVAAEERYDFIARTVRRFGYGRLKRTQKAVVLRFLMWALLAEPAIPMRLTFCAPLSACDIERRKLANLTRSQIINALQPSGETNPGETTYALSSRMG